MKKYNFNAGPSILPQEVIKQTADAVIDFQGEGLSVLEISHRAKYFQPVVDEFLKDAAGAEIDYIHGSEEVFRLGAQKGAVAVLLPPIAKDSFFETINGRGPLPRKSFSMGEADEKRFYLECRRLFS